MFDPSGSLTLSVVVCTYNRSDILGSCLQSLAAQNAERELFEVVVVDNNSTDRTFEIATSFAEQFRNFRVIGEPKQGLSNARNRGWLEARGDYVAYIDDDAIAYEGWVSAICDFVGRRPEVGVFGGPFDGFYLSDPPGWFPPEYGSLDMGSEERPIAIGKEWIIGLNMVFRKELLPRFGGFSDKLGMNGTTTAFGEEINLFLLMHEGGEQIYYVPSVRVRHLVRPEKTSLFYLISAGYLSGRNHGLTFRVERSLREILASLLFTGVKGVLLFGTAWRRPFKRTLYYALSPLAGELGALMEYCSDRRSRKAVQ